MELIDFLKKQKELLEDIKNCLEREKQVLIKGEGKNLLEIVKEKQDYISILNAIEKERNQSYPDLNLREMEKQGKLPFDIKKIGNELRSLSEKISILQQTNILLTKQSLQYINTLLFIFQGNEKSINLSYSPDGKLGSNINQDSSILDTSV